MHFSFQINIFNKFLNLRFLVILLFVISSIHLKANSKLDIQIGYSYIEHFSVGVGTSFSQRHRISALYGSDFLVNTQDFSSYLLQYEYSIWKLKKIPLTFNFGVKGGYAIYTNPYYQWELLELVPFASLTYPIFKGFQMKASGGIVWSRELSMKRISMGEIGWYQKILPEFKLAICYAIF